MENLFDYKNNLEPQRGGLIISEPYLPDPNFERTVVFLCEHNEEGSFGFVLNKTSLVNLDDIIEEIENFKVPVYIGGPVEQNTLHYLHKNPDLEGSQEVLDGIYWGGNFEQLLTMINTGNIDPQDYKFFVGYSGWGEGQLSEEHKADSWIVSNSVNEELLFDIKADNLWREVLRMMGGKYNVYSNYPIDPRLN